MKKLINCFGMLQLTKIFHFEMAHAIFGYDGACKNIHGHSYELHVTVFSVEVEKDYILAPGFILDFKELKEIVTSSIIETFDHKLVLSRDYLTTNSFIHTQENLVIWEVEPTAENMLIYIRRTLSAMLPLKVKLSEIKLYETSNSYASWKNTRTSH